MHAFTGLSFHQMSPGYTSIQLAGSRPDTSPSSFINIEPSRISSSSQRQSNEYSSIYGQTNQMIFQTPLQQNNFRVIGHDQFPAVSAFSKQNLITPVQHIQPIIRQQTPILSPTIPQVTPPRQSSSIVRQGGQIQSQQINKERKSLNELKNISSEQIDQEKQFYKLTISQHQKKIEALYQELSIKSNIINQLESQAVKIKSLQDNKIILENKLRQSQKQKNQLFETVKILQIEKQKIERASSEMSKNDQSVRVEIFGQIQKLRRELAQSRKRQARLQEKIVNYEGQMETMVIDKSSSPNIQKIMSDLDYRQKQIIKLQQALTQFESQALKHQIIKNELLHKIKSLENTVQIVQKQVQVSESNLKRKSGEILPIKSLQTQVQNLKRSLATTQAKSSSETTHFKLVITTKQQQITKLKAMLQNQQLKFQQISSRGTEGSRLLLKQIQQSKDILYKRQMLIQSIQQTLISKEQQLGAVQIQNTKLSNQLKMIQTNHKMQTNTIQDKLRQVELKNSQLAYQIKTMESQISRRSHQIDSNNNLEQRIMEINESLQVNKKQLYDSKKEYEQRIFQLLNTKNQLQIKIKQLAALSDQKQQEKQYLENQNKTIYNNYIELRKQIADFSGIQEENKLLKLKLTGTEQQLYRIRGQIQQYRSRLELTKQQAIDFKKTQQFSKIRIEQSNRDPQTIIAVLRNQNQSLKALLEDAGEKILQYSSAAAELEELQNKIMQFQDKAEKFLDSKRGHQIYTSDQQHRIMLDKIVQQMSKKLNKFKKQNQQLKKQVKNQKQTEGKRGSESQINLYSKSNSQNLQRQQQYKKQVQKIRTEFQQYRGKSKERENERINQIKNKMLDIKKTKAVDYAQKISILLDQNKRLSDIGQQYESRIKEYQALFLKFKNKQNRAANETAQIQEKKQIEYQQQIIDNVEDITQIEQRASFFKTKNIELQNRVEQLLVINTELKKQLQQQAQTIRVFEGGNLYRYQIQILQENVTNLKTKLDVVLDENNRLKRQGVFIHEGMNSDQITRIKIQQLNNQVLTLKEALAEAHQKRNLESVQRHYQHQESSSLQERIQQLQVIINKYESEKLMLIQQNQVITQKLHNFEQPDSLLYKIGLLQQEVQRLQQVNHRLNISSGGKIGSQQQGVLQAYHHLLNQVDKLLQRVDLVRTYTLELVDLISENQQSEFGSELQKNLRKIADFLQDVDAIKHTISSIRRQQQKQALRGQATIFLADI